MHHSHLLINLGDNPDRPDWRNCRRWLRNVYRVHQRLCMAFPSTARVVADPDFLAPFVPEEFADVKVARSQDHGFLFRVDPLSGSRAMIVVQSAREPDWSYAFRNAEYFLAGPPQTQPFDPRFQPGQRLGFRLLANPVRKVGKNSVDLGGKPFDERWIGKDVPVPNVDLDRWLLRRAEPEWRATKNSPDQQPPGFKIESITNIQPGYANVSKGRDDTDSKARRRRSALYEGILEVTNADHFKATINRGVGPGKAFGFGL